MITYRSNVNVKQTAKVKKKRRKFKNQELLISTYYFTYVSLELGFKEKKRNICLMEMKPFRNHFNTFILLFTWDNVWFKELAEMFNISGVLPFINVSNLFSEILRCVYNIFMSRWRHGIKVTVILCSRTLYVKWSGIIKVEVIRFCPLARLYLSRSGFFKIFPRNICRSFFRVLTSQQFLNAWHS